MKRCNRRAFIKATVGAAGAASLLPAGESNWYTLRVADQHGYFESEFGITQVLCRKALSRALGKGGDFAELFFEHSVRNVLVLEDGQVERAYSSTDLDVGIRTVVGDQVASTRQPTKGGITGPRKFLVDYFPALADKAFGCESHRVALFSKRRTRIV